MKQFVLLLLISVGFSAFAQESSSYDERLLSLYSAEKLEKMQIGDPNELDFLNYYVENGFVIQKTVQEKYDMQDFPVIEVDAENINIFELLKFDPYMQDSYYKQYKIEGETAFLFVYTMEKAKKEYLKIK